MNKITLRDAVAQDVEMVYRWRNHPLVRNQSFNIEPIQYAAHEEWFTKTLGMETRQLLIALFKAKPIGVLRFDLSCDASEVSIFLNPDEVGKGLGAEMLQAGVSWLRDNFKQVISVVAKVRPENVASCKTFEKSGFVFSNGIYQLKLLSSSEGRS